jgi:histidyl-tRNA synthetase
LIQRPKGTEDILPSSVYKWHYIEKLAAEIAGLYGFSELRFPVFEYTELFTRSVGESSDIVGKEMYTFTDKGERSLTLRPEGTAGAVRAAVQNGLLNNALPQKVWYNITAYRYENVQKGRQREFRQFGAEVFGTSSPFADAEIITLVRTLYDRLGLSGIALEINSIGCPECRKNYTDALKNYFSTHKDTLCGTCNTRLETNPMRILDCKSPVCKEIAASAPIILDYLCEECKTHFDTLQKILTAQGSAFTVNPRIVRGLDYYTKTVFEFIAEGVGTQGTVCGGGRYDGLIGEISGKAMPALGFAMGLERLLLAMSEQGIEIPKPPAIEYFIGSTDGFPERAKAAEVVKKLRETGHSAETDIVGRGVKAQMKYADKIGSTYAGIIGENELATGQIKLKNMKTGEEQLLELANLHELKKR